MKENITNARGEPLSAVLGIPLCLWSSGGPGRDAALNSRPVAQIFVGLGGQPTRTNKHGLIAARIVALQALRSLGAARAESIGKDSQAENFAHGVRPKTGYILWDPANILSPISRATLISLDTQALIWSPKDIKVNEAELWEEHDPGARELEPHQLLNKILDVAIMQACYRAYEPKPTDGLPGLKARVAKWLTAGLEREGNGIAEIKTSLGIKMFLPVDIPDNFKNDVRERGFVSFFIELWWQSLFHAMQAWFAWTIAKDGALAPETDTDADGQQRWIKWRFRGEWFELKNYGYPILSPVERETVRPRDEQAFKALEEKYNRNHRPPRPESYPSAWWSAAFTVRRTA